MNFKEFFKPTLGKAVLFVLAALMLSGLACADVVIPPYMPPGEYKIVDYTRAYVFDGNFDDYTFACMGDIKGMCDPVIVTPSSTVQTLTCPKYKLCSPKLYAFPKTEFDNLVKEQGIEITSDGWRSEENQNQKFLQDFVDQNKVTYAVEDFNYLIPGPDEYTSYYDIPRDDPEYKILSEKAVTQTFTIKGVDFQNKKILNDTKEEVTKFVDYTNGGETPALTPTPQNSEPPAPTPTSQAPTPSQAPSLAGNELPLTAIFGIAVVAAIAILAVVFLKKRK